MEGGLQPPQTTLGPRKHAAGRVRDEINAGKTGRMRPETMLRPPKLDRSKLEFSAVTSLGWEEWKTMKASKFSDAQKAFILKQGADGIPVAEICRRAGISQATYFIYGRLSHCKPKVI
jgi:hypothetical protein